MPRVFPMGHRRRGAGLTVASLMDIERAQILSRHFGNTIYVNSAAASGGSGTSWTDAYQTIVLGIAGAAAGDTIYVAPGHTENVSAAGYASFSKALTVLGVGLGRKRPVFTWTGTTASTLLVTAANVYLANMVFNFAGASAIDNVTTGFTISASDCTFDNCEFVTGDASAQCAIVMTTTAAADRLSVLDCFFHGSTDAGTTNCLQLIGGDGIQIIGNVFSGAYTTSLGAINNITTACTNIIVMDNTINNLTASSTKAMVFLSTTTGQAARNYMQILSGTAPITGAALSWVGGNYYAATIATAGTLI